MNSKGPSRRGECDGQERAEYSLASGCTAGFYPWTFNNPAGKESACNARDGEMRFNPLDWEDT